MLMTPAFSPASSPARFKLNRLLCIMALGLASGLSLASADEAGEISRLLNEGRVEQASTKVDNYLRANPGDVQMRFMQGLIAAEQHKSERAIKIFTELTRDHPNLPEPYNNLAVLYAAQGQDQKAVEVLEKAIRVSPGYPTAYENLGDLYVRMAAELYGKSLELDASNKALEPKFAQLSRLLPGGDIDQQALSARTKDAPAASQPAPSPQSGSSAIAAKEPPASPVVQEAAPSPDVEQIKSVVTRWARAWESQDLESYLGAYSEQFVPAGGLSLDKWKIQRRQRIVGRPDITVKIHEVKVSVQGDTASARFRQDYASGVVKDSVHKTLRMKREGDAWRIVGETTS
ncbi:nuclear transport factor 2 family protein [Comamonas composti]|uniref:nuclear transport factor 2 family protein n=1 Tax=Comamonas composti TaxID=408558 RepID=UPI000404AA9B|nr:nuclear transport factor 2 family protein [Comamonas composti]